MDRSQFPSQIETAACQALPVFTLFNSSVLFGMAFVYAFVVAKFRTIFGAPDEAELEQLQRSIDERRERSGSLLKPPDRRHSMHVRLGACSGE